MQLVILVVPVTITPSTLPNATEGVAYSQTLVAQGGAGGPYTFSAPASSLPAGLSLSSSGVLAGTPTVAGTFSVPITVTDAEGNSYTF